MTSDELGQLRLRAQHVTHNRFKKVEDVVRWMGALQAQDYGQAVWALGSRLSGATLQDVEQALADVKIVRTWPMRGTIHFVPAEDAKWMVQLSEARMVAGVKRRQEQLGLNAKILERSQELFADALRGGKYLSRPAMMRLLEDNGINTKGGPGYHLLWYAAQRGQLCVGPMEGKQQTFALLDDVVPQARSLSREEGLAELAGRYFASHGPATLKDFAWWAGLTMSDAKLGIENAQHTLVSETVDGTTYWRSPENHEANAAAEVCLLAGFDEFLLGYQNRSAVLEADYADRIVPGGNGIFKPMLVVGGQITGTWQRSVKKKVVEITLIPFRPLGDAEQGAMAAAERYAAFHGLPAEVRVQT